jgi:hypothetical protein
MPYTAEISRSNPTAFLFLVDQSGSMSDKISSGKSKAEEVADVLNRTLATLIVRCTRADGTRNYFDLGVIGYGGDGAYNGFEGALSSSILHPLSAVEAAPLRIEERQKKISDGAGGIVEQAVKFPVWFEPRASGGTPCARRSPKLRKTSSLGATATRTATHRPCFTSRTGSRPTAIRRSS